MRAVSSDTVARMLHVFVLHAPCEVAAPHESAAFDMQMHERLNAVPRGQLCLILGDFNARVGSIAADCFGTHAPVTENQNGERMRELLTESNMVALNTFFPGEPLHMDESGRKACQTGLRMCQCRTPCLYQVGWSSKGH